MLRNSSGVRPSSRIWRRLVSNARCTSRTLGRGRTHPSSGRRPARSPRCPGSCPCGSWTGGCRGVRARPSTIGAGTAIPYLPYHRLHVRPGHVRRARQVVVVRGFRQPGYPQEVVEPVSPPCEQSDDGASLAPRDLDARRARSFSRYATFAFRYATCSASSCSRVGSGFGLDFAPFGLPLGFGLSASGPPDR